MKRRIALLAAGLVLAGSLSGLVSPAEAGLRDLFNRGQSGSAAGAAPLPPGDVNAGQGPVLAQSSQQDGQAAMRMERIEQQMRTLTGQVEQLTFQLRQLQEQLQRMQQDSDFRLKQLEGGRGGKRSEAAPPAAAPQQAAPQMTPPPAAPQPRQQAAPAQDPIGETIGSGDDMPMDGGGNFDNRGAPPRDLGQMAVDPNGAPLPPGNGPIDLSQLGAGGAASAEAPAGPSGNPRTDYDAAYSHIMKGDYDYAEAAFKQFLQAYPKDPLAADAQFWIGESLYAREDYRGSADAFLAGYKRYPKSPKAPDMLLKLGLSLSGLGQREAACATYSQILKQYPQSSKAMLDRVKSEQASASC